MVRAPLWRAGAGPVGRDPRTRRRGAPGHAACRSSCVPPPASRSLLGEGGRPLGSGGAEGRRSCGLQAGGGAGGGGRSAASRPPRPVRCRPAFLFLWCAPLGYTRAVGVAGRPWASGAARSAANGSAWRGGGGEGGSDLLALVRAPAFPRPASEGAAPFAPSWAPPFRCPSVAGKAGVCGRFTGGAWRAAALAAAAVSPPLGAASSPGGCGTAVSPVGLRPLLGRWGGGRGGGPPVP